MMPRRHPTCIGPPSMKIIWIIVAILVALWVAGNVIGFLGDIIHLVIVIAIALAIFAFVKRKV